MKGESEELSSQVPQCQMAPLGVSGPGSGDKDAIVQ